MAFGNTTSDNEMKRNFEISDRDGQDSTQDSLTEEAKSLLNTHKLTQVDIFQKEKTPLGCQTSALTPNTVKQRRNVLTDATPVAAAFSEGALQIPHRRTYLNIAETREENKQLKAEIFDLKSQLFMLKSKLPSILDSEGKDFTGEYLMMQTELDNEKVRRVKMEQMWHSEKKKLEEERSRFESERNNWEKKRERLLMDRDELASELKELCQQLCERRGERDDGNESQGDSSLSTISLISERGMEIERLRSAVLRQSVDEKKLQIKMEQNMIQLQNELKLAQDDLSKQTDYYEMEKKRCETLEAEITKLQRIADEAKHEAEYWKQISTVQLAEAHAVSEVALNKRDQTIRILLTKLESADLRPPSNSKIEKNNSSPLHSVVPDLNPHAKAVLDQINEFSIENDAIRKKVIEWGAMNVDIPSQTEYCETQSTENESSEWNTKRCERENKKLAAFLAQNKIIHDGSNDEELGEKLALFDAVNGSGGRHSKELLEDTVRSMGASEMLSITSAADLLSKSLVLTEDIGEVKRKFLVLQSAFTCLFEKLRGTANFLQTLLDELGAGDRGRKLLAEIEALRIDLDHSLAATIDISRDVEAAEESVGDLSTHLQRSLLNSSFGISSALSSENQASALSRAHKVCRRLNMGLANEKMKANEANKLNEKLQMHVTGLEESKQKLIIELNELKKNMAEKENEVISTVKDMEAQLQLKNQQCDELYEKVKELQQVVKTNEILSAEREADMKLLTEQITSKNHELKNQVKEITGLDKKMCDLIGSIKESLGIVDEQVDKPVIEVENTDVAALAQLSQIGADIEELSKVSHFIADLRNQMVRLQQGLDVCERSRDAISLKCQGLSDKNASLEAERIEAEKKLLALQQQMQTEKETVKMMERDLHRSKSENICIKENNERLTEMLINIETKYEEITSKRNGSSLTERQHSERYTVTIGTMTLLSSCDFAELTDKTKTLSSFAKRMYALATQWSDNTTVTFRVSYKSTDLHNLYHTYARILNRLSDSLNELRNKMTCDTVKLQSLVCEGEQNSQQAKTESSISSNNDLGTSSFISVYGSQSELASIDLRPLFSDADYVVQKLKAISNRLHDVELLEVLSNMRSLRFQIDSLRRYSGQLERTKENVIPMEGLKLENERLQTVLSDAQILLQRAHERLSKLPNSKDMCEQILCEMNEISKAMKATTRQMRRIRNRSRGTVGGKSSN